MIRVILRKNVDRVEDIIESTVTVREFLEKHNVDYSRGSTMIDGSVLGAGDMDRTFESFGITTKCFVSNVVKTDNA